MSDFNSLAEGIALNSVELINIQDEYSGIQYRRTGILRLDWILASHSPSGGLACQRQFEISGPENSGKTTLTLALCASVQRYKKRNVAVYFDWEKKLNLQYALNLGVDLSPEKFRLYRMTGSEALKEYHELCDRSYRSDDVGIVVTDSAAAMATKGMLDGEVGEAHVGAVARAQSTIIRDWTNGCPANGPVKVWINQERKMIGGFFDGSKTTGADAIRYFCAVRMSVYQGEKLKDTVAGRQENVGQVIKVNLRKNHIGVPGGDAEISLSFKYGFEKDNYEFIRELTDDFGIAAVDRKTKTVTCPVGTFLVKDWPYCLTQTQVLELYKLCVQKRKEFLLKERQDWAAKKASLVKAYEAKASQEPLFEKSQKSEPNT